MIRFAAVATLLMLFAPLLSRALQAPAAVAATAHMAHEMPGMDHHHAAHAPAAPGQAHGDTSANPHAAHGEACDYCVLAMRLLPWLALLVLLASVPIRPLLPVSRQGVFPASLHWPAHPARGPPRFS